MLFSKYPYHNFSDYNLDWVIEVVKTLTPKVAELQEWRNEHEAEYQQLKSLYDDIMRGNFPNSMIESLYNWLNDNASDIIGNVIKNVFFGLTDSGYFVAYIPDGWQEVIFNTTGYDITVDLMPEFGHLVLSY